MVVVGEEDQSVFSDRSLVPNTGDLMGQVAPTGPVILCF